MPQFMAVCRIEPVVDWTGNPYSLPLLRSSIHELYLCEAVHGYGYPLTGTRNATYILGRRGVAFISAVSEYELF